MDEQVQRLCAELSSTEDAASRRAFLVRHPELLEQNVVEQLADTVRTTVRVDVPLALRLAEAALAIAEELDNGEARGRGLRAKANAMWFMGQCKTAVHLFTQAVEQFEQAGNRYEVARTLSSSIQSLVLLGEYQVAIAAAGRAREIFTSLGDDWRVARLELNLANIHHRQNHFAQALTAYENAYMQLRPHKDAEGIGVALHNMAVCLIVLDDFPHALTIYQELREFCSQNEMPLLVAQADYNIAYLRYLRGDYTQAIQLLRTTRETCRKNGDLYHLALCDLDQSEIYLELRLVDEAAEMAQSSFKQFESLSMPFETGRSLVNLAIAASLQSDFDRALQLFERAKTIMSNEKNRVWPFLIDLYSVVVLLDKGESEKSRELCANASTFFHDAGMPSKYVLCLLISAKISLATGDFHRAVHACEEALEILPTLHAPILAYQAHLLQGEAYERLANRADAYASYHASHVALETLRSSIQKEELKISFMRNRADVYSRLARLCLERDSTQASAEEALSYVESAKARTLRDLLLGGAPAVTDAGTENEVDEQIRELREELNWFYHRIEREQLSQEGSSPEQLRALQKEAAIREHRLLHLIREAPDSAAVGVALRQSSTATLADIREALGPEAALIEYFAIDNRIHAAVVTPDSVRFIPLASFEAITPHLRMLAFQFSKFKLSREYVSGFAESLLRTTQTHLLALNELLFLPLEHLLSVRQLVIVPYGPLHSLPFHALFNGHGYLADDFTMCYAPSASIFAQLPPGNETLEGPSLLLGVEDEKTPFIREEISAVAAAVPNPEVFLGSGATDKILRDRGRRSRLIHIASHGQFRPDSPMFSAIRLADSHVTLYDFYHMKLPVDLLTLSGCATGLSVIDEGDEVLGLARGLLYSGAHSLLLTSWEVDDQSTSLFMKYFYSRLRTKPGKADAVRSAMLMLRESYPHPYYWAPFRLLGKIR